MTKDSGHNVVCYSDENGPSLTRTSTHPLNSGFMLFNAPAEGPYDFTATVDETKETESTLRRSSRRRRR